MRAVPRVMVSYQIEVNACGTLWEEHSFLFLPVLVRQWKSVRSLYTWVTSVTLRIPVTLYKPAMTLTDGYCYPLSSVTIIAKLHSSIAHTYTYVRTTGIIM